MVIVRVYQAEFRFSIPGVDLTYKEGAPLMIMEYMPYGDLCDFLRKNKPTSTKPSLLKKNELMGFASDVCMAKEIATLSCGSHYFHVRILYVIFQIANALAFLEANKYVHRDIAARNCLGRITANAVTMHFSSITYMHTPFFLLNKTASLSDRNLLEK